jgi:CubicO group peptidase (beta-lactamase class C family)
MVPRGVLARVVLALLPVTLSGSGKLRAQEPANAAVDAVFAEYAKPGSPGCALAVYRDGKILYEKGYGLANIEQSVPITPQSVFDIGSTSKQFSAASILLLEQQGKLSIDDDVRKFIPELPDYKQKITVRNLLNHTSGLRDYLTLMDLAGVNIDGVTTDDDALAIITRQKGLNFAPGSEYLYSNSGFFLLSVIVKRVSGRTLREFAAENIFQPLGMAHTSYRDDHTSLIPNRALAYEPAEKGRYKLAVSYFEQTGDGAVHTSVEDLLRWDENFYAGRILGKDLLARLQEQGRLTTGKTLDYAKGLVIGEYRGLRTVSHGGSWGGYRAQLLRFPDRHFSVACLCNVGNANPSRKAREVADVYLAGQMKPKESAASAGANPAVSLTAAQLQPLVGIYRDAAKGEVRRVTEKEGKLYLEAFGSQIELRPKSPTEFEPANFPVDAKVVFEPAAGGAPRKLRIAGSGLTTTTYEAFAVATPNDLTAYAGEYWSDELQVTYKLAIEDGKLIVRAKNLPTGPLRPTVADEFDLAGSAIVIRFHRGADKHITGFLLDAGRTRGMVFTRRSSAKQEEP